MKKDLTDQFKGKKLAIIGDVMLDRFIWGDVSRVSPEAPVPIVHAKKETFAPGGAANTAANITSLGGSAYLFGFVGKDPAAGQLKNILSEARVNSDHLIAIDMKTIEKIRIVGQGQQLVRIDYEENLKLTRRTEQQLLDDFQAQKFDSVIISDYAKGAITQNLAEEIITTSLKKKTPVLVDPKPQNLEFYRGATLVTPNDYEAAQMTGIAGKTDSLVEKKAQKISKMLGSNVIITRGGKGMTLSLLKGRTLHIGTKAREVFDVSGAGDTVAATLGMCLSTGMSLEKAAEIANFAGGVAVSKLGTSRVHSDELRMFFRKQNPKQKTLEEIRRIVAELKQKNKTIVWTNGCFDILHVGHIKYLQEAKSHGDCLIIGVNSDSSVEKLKGENRPIIGETERVEILSSLEFVDYVILFDEERVTRFLKELKPDVFIKGGDYSIDTLDQEERSTVQKYGGRIVLIPPIKDKSTTNMIKKILNSHK